MADPAPIRAYGRSALLIQVLALTAGVCVAYGYWKTPSWPDGMAVLGFAFSAYIVFAAWGWLLTVRAIHANECRKYWFAAFAVQILVSIFISYVGWHHGLNNGFETLVIAPTVVVPGLFLSGASIAFIALFLKKHTKLRRIANVLVLTLVVVPIVALLHVTVETMCLDRSSNNLLGDPSTRLKFYPSILHDIAFKILNRCSNAESARAAHLSLYYGLPSINTLKANLPDEHGRIENGKGNYVAVYGLFKKAPEVMVAHFKDLLDPNTPRSQAYSYTLRKQVLECIAEIISDDEIRDFLAMPPEEPSFDSVTDSAVQTGISYRKFHPLETAIEAYLHRHAASGNSESFAHLLMRSYSSKKNVDEQLAIRALWFRMLRDTDPHIRNLAAGSATCCEDYKFVREVSEHVLKTHDLPLRRALLHGYAMNRAAWPVPFEQWASEFLFVETEHSDAFCRFAAAQALRNLLNMTIVKTLDYSPSRTEIDNPEPEQEMARAFIQDIRRFAPSYMEGLRK